MYRTRRPKTEKNVRAAYNDFGQPIKTWVGGGGERS